MRRYFAGILAFGMMAAGLAMAQAPIAEQPAAGYQPKFAGDPARSEAEAQALGYMRVVLRAENTYKKRHNKYAESLEALAGRDLSPNAWRARPTGGLHGQLPSQA